MCEKLSGPLKRVAAVHDLSGFGKCSMTVAMPIISAAGLECCCMPTAILSTHTGGFTGYTYRDLTEDLEAFGNHWAQEGLAFDCIYTGFLGSPEQASIICDFIDRFNTEDNLVCVDPAMADGGQLYKIFDDDMVIGMRKLCAKADLVMPNITEAALLTGLPYKTGPYTEEEILTYVKALADMGPRYVVLTGISFKADEEGAACYDAKTGALTTSLEPLIPGRFHGTGDVFGSFLVAALVRGVDLTEAAAIAVHLTRLSILRTVERGTPVHHRVDFEGVLPDMMRALHLV